ncbi:MAG: cell division protein ZapD [Candidatus Competibacteraceae bacterium]|nr:cell division protein ZapD [Candidatus Competibacteraceae bacterium]
MHQSLTKSSEGYGLLAIQGILGILGLTSRAELKAELLKELERYAQSLSRLRQTPSVDVAILDAVLANIGHVTQHLQRLSNQMLRQARKNEFLDALSRRSPVQGSASAFDSPALYHWLHQDYAVRVECLEQWLLPVQPIRDAVELLLRIIRDSAVPDEQVAQQGLFQKTLDSTVPSQLVRIILPDGTPVFPETSGSKHRLSIRFMEQRNFKERPRQCAENIVFRLACCVF